MVYAYNDDPIPVDSRAHEAPIVAHDILYPGAFEREKVIAHYDTAQQPQPVQVIIPAEAATPPAPVKTSSTICGLRRRVFYCVLIAAFILLIGAVAGLAVGLVVQRNHRSSSDEPDVNASGSDSGDAGGPAATTTSGSGASSTATPASSVLDKSQIATTKWVNETGIITYVVYQDPVGSIMLSYWHSSSSTWKSANISDRMLIARSPISPKLGTPLASLTWDNSDLVVVFIDELDTVRAVHTVGDGEYRSWHHSRMYGPGRLSIPASPQSSLAGYWFYCWATCQESEWGRNKLQVFVEGREDNDIQLYIDQMRDTNLTATSRPGSGLATTPSLTTSGEMRMLLFYDTGEKLGMMHRKSADDRTWVLDEAFRGETHPTFPGQKIAATSFPPVSDSDGSSPPGWAILAVQLEKDGSLSATYWDPKTREWTFGSPVELIGGPDPPPKFTAIGLNLDLRFYGIADGAILEYRVDKSAFTSFYFVSNPVLP